MTITMIKKEMKLKEGTKTVYQEIENIKEIITKEEYDNIILAKKFFQSFGSKEEQKKGHTKIGYVVNKILTTLPDKTKIERTFLFV